MPAGCLTCGAAADRIEVKDYGAHRFYSCSLCRTEWAAEVPHADLRTVVTIDEILDVREVLQRPLTVTQILAGD